MMTIQKLWCDFLSAVNKKSSLTFLLVLLLLQPPLSQGVEGLPVFDLELVQKNQSGPKYQIGDRVQFSISLPVNILHQITNLQIKYIDEKNTLDQQGLYIDPSPQVINGSLRFAIYPIKSGSLIIPELTVFKESDSIVGKTKPFAIEVNELQKPEEQPDFIDTIPISMPIRFVLFGIIILSILILSAIYFYKKAKSRKVIAPVSESQLPPIPDFEIANRELESLYQRYSYSPENLKPIAFGVSEVLKKYFSSRFKIDATESTTDEMIELLKLESVNGADIIKIKTLFNDLDIIKFTELIHHQHFQKHDFFGFKEQAQLIIGRWSNDRGDTPR